MTLRPGDGFIRRWAWNYTFFRGFENPRWRSVVCGFLMALGKPGVLLNPSQGFRFLKR